VALVTTGGVHQRNQVPFKRREEEVLGDGSYRLLDLKRPLSELTITHDWYDHTDAEADLNLVLPVERLRELAAEGVIGSVHQHAFGLMGHVEEREERRVELQSAPAIARTLRREEVQAVVLVPA
jgi:D-proline reductase (dithiol) PrdB